MAKSLLVVSEYVNKIYEMPENCSSSYELSILVLASSTLSSWAVYSRSCFFNLLLHFSMLPTWMRKAFLSIQILLCNIFLFLFFFWMKYAFCCYDNVEKKWLHVYSSYRMHFFMESLVSTIKQRKDPPFSKVTMLGHLVELEKHRFQTWLSRTINCDRIKTSICGCASICGQRQNALYIRRIRKK